MGHFIKDPGHPVLLDHGQREALLVALMPVLAVEPASATTVTARSLLLRLSLKAESGSSTYRRTYFKHWVDADGDCQNARAEVLIAESKITPKYTTTRHCTVTTGRWYSYYDGVYWTRASVPPYRRLGGKYRMTRGQTTAEHRVGVSVPGTQP